MWSRIDLRAGRIDSAIVFAKAKKPAYQLVVNFGDGMIRQSSAQLTRLYQPEDLVGRMVMAVCNFPVRIIAGFKSQILVTGLIESDGITVHLAQPEAEVQVGDKVIAFGYSLPQITEEIDWALFESVEKVVGTLAERKGDKWLVDIGKEHVSCPAPPSGLPIGSKLLILREEASSYVLGWHRDSHFITISVDKPDGIPNGTPLL